MKKTLILVMFLSLSVSLSSCSERSFRCFLLALFYGSDLPVGLALVAAFFGDDAGEDCFEEGNNTGLSALSSLIVTTDNALHAEEPVVLPRAESEIPQRLPPPQIEGGPISSEPGGGNQQEEETGSAFKDIITAPTFTLGPSLSWLGGDKGDSEKFPAKPGFQLGAQWQVPLTDRVSFEPGLLYANRGLGYESEESGYYQPGVPTSSYSYGQKKRMHYLELPLLASYSIVQGLDLYGGPQVAFLLGAKVVNESNGETTSTEKGTKGFNKVDVGLSAGARYRIPNTPFSVSLGYCHSFSNLVSGSEYGGGYGYDEPKYYTNSARIGVCYTYRGASNRKKSAGTGRMAK